MNRQKVTRANRAAQFAPFDALKGLQEALREKEEKMERVEKSEISEEQREKLSHDILSLKKGMSVEAVFFDSGHYVTEIGKLTEKNMSFKYLVVNDKKIFFTDIFELKEVIED